MGIDGVSAFNGLCNGFDLNIVFYQDPSHAAQRAFEGMLRATGYWPMWLLCLITWKMEFGPWGDETRRGELSEAMRIIYNNFTPQECPLYMDLLLPMVQDLE